MDAVAISEAFERKYGKHLKDAIKSECSGNYKRLAIAWCTLPDTLAEPAAEVALWAGSNLHGAFEMHLGAGTLPNTSAKRRRRSGSAPTESGAGRAARRLSGRASGRAARRACRASRPA